MPDDNDIKTQQNDTPPPLPPRQRDAQKDDTPPPLPPPRRQPTPSISASDLQDIQELMGRMLDERLSQRDASPTTQQENKEEKEKSKTPAVIDKMIKKLKPKAREEAGPAPLKDEEIYGTLPAEKPKENEAKTADPIKDKQDTKEKKGKKDKSEDKKEKESSKSKKADKEEAKEKKDPRPLSTIKRVGMRAAQAASVIGVIGSASLIVTGIAASATGAGAAIGVPMIAAGLAMGAGSIYGLKKTSSRLKEAAAARDLQDEKTSAEPEKSKEKEKQAEVTESVSKPKEKVRATEPGEVLGKHTKNIADEKQTKTKGHGR